MSQRARSPVLGYNHNLRHGGRVFHIQTEDSGQGYARLYTHLFYQGTILSSKKQEYDANAPEQAVRVAMQMLHKSMITELVHAEHDARIAAFFIARGEPPTLAEPALPPAVAAPPAQSVAAAPAATPAPIAKATTAPRPGAVVQPVATRRQPPVVVSNPTDGVVVRRNVVINVGGGQPPVHGASQSPVQGASQSAVHGTIGTIGAIGTPNPPAAWPARARGGGAYAVRDGAGYVAGNRARAAAPTVEAQPQPLASSRDIRMPWETPGPTRTTPVAQSAGHVAQSIGQAVDGPSLTAAGKLRMPWDPPTSTGPDAFSSERVSDKSLDEVILEYLADDAEADEH